MELVYSNYKNHLHLLLFYFISVQYAMIMMHYHGDAHFVHVCS